MCLIVLAWQIHPDFPLVVAANRDEFYQRPTQDAAPWPEAPHLIAGRDLEAGGTWMGISTKGRFAAVTNVREPGTPKGQSSRGILTQNFLLGKQDAASYLNSIDNTLFSGYNLLLCDGKALWYQSNRDGGARHLTAGIYAVSNHLLDTPWPKIVSARRRFADALTLLPDREDFFALLSDDQVAADNDLPSTGVPLAWERMLSAIFVRSDDYGTRASSVVTCHRAGEIDFEERRFGPQGSPLGKNCYCQQPASLAY